MNVTSVRGLATISLSRASVATRVGVSRAWTTAVEAVNVSVEFDLFVGLLHPGRSSCRQVREALGVGRWRIFESVTASAVLRSSPIPTDRWPGIHVPGIHALAWCAPWDSNPEPAD